MSSKSDFRTMYPVSATSLHKSGDKAPSAVNVVTIATELVNKSSLGSVISAKIRSLQPRAPCFIKSKSRSTKPLLLFTT